MTLTDQRILSEYPWSAYCQSPDIFKPILESNLVMGIVAASDGKLNEDFLLSRRCMELLSGDPEFRESLLDGWKKGSFDQVRSTGVLQRFTSQARLRTADRGPETRLICGAVGVDDRATHLNIYGGNFTDVHGDLINYPNNESKIRNWICGMDYARIQIEISTKRQEGSGEWFLATTQFSDWIEGKFKILWCPGLPGVGKTFISSLVVDYLQQNVQVPTCVVYLNYKRHAIQNPSHILSAILRQLLESYPDQGSAIRDLYHYYSLRSSRPTEAELTDVMVAVTHNVGPITVILDALDEYSMEYQGDHAIGIVHRLNALENIRLLVTSRVLGDMDSRFCAMTAGKLPILTADRDIELCLQSYFSGKLLGFVAYRDTIIEKILNNSRGRMLLAHLQVQWLSSLLTWGEMRDALERLPHEFDFAYQQVIQRINEQSELRKQLAWRVLMWTACSRGPLSLTELRYALALPLTPSGASVDDYQHSPDVLSSVCVGLVFIDLKTDLVGFVHQTVQQFFDKGQQMYFPTAHSVITATCFRAISPLGLQEILHQGATYPDRLPLGRYIAENWHHHLVKCERQFLHTQEALDRRRHNIFQALYTSLAWENISVVSLTYSPTSPCAPFSRYVSWLGDVWADSSLQDVHLLAALDLSDTLQAILGGNGSLDARTADCFGFTPLEIALEFGAHQTSKMLWEISCEDDKWQQLDHSRMLNCAIRGGIAEIVNKLLDVADAGLINSTDMDDMTPLMVAAESGRAAIIRKLLTQQELDMNAKTDKGFSVLKYALHSGDNDTIEALLQDLRLNLSEPAGSFSADFLNPIWPEGLQVSTYLWLQTHRAEEFLNQSGTTIANSATVTGRLDVVSSILGAFPDEADKQDKRGLTPLAHAARMGHADIVEYLLTSDFQIDVNSSDEHGITPLLHALRHDAAARPDWLEVNEVYWPDPLYGDMEAAALVKLLLHHGADPYAVDNHGYTALFYAAIAASQPVLELLILEWGISINSVDLCLRTPLSYVFGASDAVCIETMPSPTASPRRWTAAKWLLDRGADLYDEDGEGLTPLDRAVLSENELVLKEITAYMEG